jgi:hypothetical protein
MRSCMMLLLLVLFDTVVLDLLEKSPMEIYVLCRSGNLRICRLWIQL